MKIEGNKYEGIKLAGCNEKEGRLKELKMSETKNERWICIKRKNERMNELKINIDRKLEGEEK